MYSAAFPDAGTPLRCPGDCAGFELDADLDFDAAGRWISGRGWEPIGLRVCAAEMTQTTLSRH